MVFLKALLEVAEVASLNQKTKGTFYGNYILKIKQVWNLDLRDLENDL